MLADEISFGGGEVGNLDSGVAKPGRDRRETAGKLVQRS
jgi:hypothetical protein